MTRFQMGGYPPPPAPAERWAPSMGLKSYIPHPALSPCRDGQSGEVGAQAVLGGLMPSWDTGGGGWLCTAAVPPAASGWAGIGQHFQLWKLQLHGISFPLEREGRPTAPEGSWQCGTCANSTHVGS